MDFHILTKKQAECLHQIGARTAVSSFFEPLRTMRELESLQLIRRFLSTQFDSGFGYELTPTGVLLAKWPAGTKYSIMPNGDVAVHNDPAAADSEAVRRVQNLAHELQARNDEQARMIQEGLQRERNLRDVAEKRLEEITDYQQRVRDLDSKCEQMERELVKAQDDLKLLRSQHAANDLARRQAIDNYNGLAQALRSERAAVANLQNIINDYATQQKVDRAAIKALQRTEDLYSPKAFENFTVMPMNVVGQAIGLGDGCKGQKYVVFHFKDRPNELLVRTVDTFASIYVPHKK